MITPPKSQLEPIFLAPPTPEKPEVPFKSVDLSYTRTIVDIISETSDLITALHNDREPSATDHIFTFKPNEDGQDVLSDAILPNSIIDALRSRSLAEVVIRFTSQQESVDGDNDALDISTSDFNIQFITDDDSVFVFSRSTNIDDGETKDTMGSFDDDGFHEFKDFPRVPNQELNLFIISLINATEAGEFKQIDPNIFANQDLLEPNLYRYIVSELENCNTEQRSTEFYGLEASDNKELGVIQFSIENSALTGMKLTQIINQQGDAIIAELDCAPSQGVSIHFYRKDVGKDRYEIAATEEQLQELRSFISQNIRRYDVTTVSLINPDTVTDADDDISNFQD
jgi:hypothetical protein